MAIKRMFNLCYKTVIQHRLSFVFFLGLFADFRQVNLTSGD